MTPDHKRTPASSLSQLLSSEQTRAEVERAASSQKREKLVMNAKTSGTPVELSRHHIFQQKQVEQVSDAPVEENGIAVCL